MTVNVGLVGLGMIGRIHRAAYADIPSAALSAVCDVDAERLRLEAAETGARAASDYDALLADEQIDAVDLCVPTYLHAEMTVLALEAGKHVFCEKPMALNAAEAGRMLQAARRAGKRLMVGHVLRFWGEYVALKAMIDAGGADGPRGYGRVRSAVLRRLSGPPGWSGGWYDQAALSGSAALDLHVHDADVVRWWFSRPERVVSTGVDEGPAGVRHIVTQYHYEGGPVVVAEGGWLGGDVPFAMSATVDFEHATAVYDSSASPTLRVFREDGATEAPETPPADAYREELAEFVACVEAGRASERAAPGDARNAVAMVEAEIESLRTGAPVPVAE